MIRLSLANLAIKLGATLVGDPEVQISGVATLASATQSDASFLANTRYTSQLSVCKAGVVLMEPSHQQHFKGNKLLLENPYLGYARISKLFAPVLAMPGIDAAASVSLDAIIGANVFLGSGVVIGARANIGDGVVIGPNSVVGADSHVGENSVLASNVSIYHGVKIGHRAVIHSGAVLGSDGFGFAKQSDQYIKIYQLGGVTVGDDVEIGACTTIDRGALDDTVVGNGVKLDNHIQIAHNVVLGDNTAIAGCTGIAGSTTIGENCTLAAACIILGHLSIADNTLVTAGTLVTRSISESGAYSSGTGLDKQSNWRRNAVRFKQLDQMAKKISQLEQQVTSLTQVANK